MPHLKSVYACWAVVCSLIVGMPARAASPTADTFFGPISWPQDSTYTYNVSFSTWLLGGVDSIRSKLQRLADAFLVPPSELQTLKAMAIEEARRMGSATGAVQTIERRIAEGNEQILGLQRIARAAPDDSGRRLAERNLEALRQELALLEGARERLSTYSRRLEELAATAETWAEFWSVTERARGDAQTRKQIADLAAKELQRWDALYRREIAETLLARNLRIPEELPAPLLAAFRKMASNLPRLQGGIQISPQQIHPLYEAAPTGGISFVLTTTAATRTRILVTGPDGTSTHLDSVEIAPRRYRAEWKPPFLTDNTWRSKIRKSGRIPLGDWRFTVELHSTPETTGAELLTGMTNFSLQAALEAPLGVSLQTPPRKPSFLREYPREEDIPLEQRHHVLAILSYPILGLPRDLIDSVFGAIDKVPYVSLPINLIYAAPGQLLCKPWWDDEYRPFAEQSAGFYAWGARDTNSWQYFENYLTWVVPENRADADMAALLYIGLGFPRDAVDAVFGGLDQIPYVTTPLMYLYQPLTVLTKPWYSDRYRFGQLQGKKRVPYCEQSKHVICLDDWWTQSRWVFFENYKTTTFRSPNVEKRDRLVRRHRGEMAAFQQAVRATEDRNEKVRSSCVISLQPAETSPTRERAVGR